MPYKDKERERIKVKIWRQKTKQKAVDYLGGKCVECGYNKCLAAMEFHHFNMTEKDFGIGRLKSRSFEGMKQELDKCELLCANCHREKHYENFL